MAYAEQAKEASQQGPKPLHGHTGHRSIAGMRGSKWVQQQHCWPKCDTMHYTQYLALMKIGPRKGSHSFWRREVQHNMHGDQPHQELQQ